MVGELMTLPLRLSMRAAGVVVRVGLNASGRALDLAGDVVNAVVPNGSAPSVPPGDQEQQTEPPAPAAPPAPTPAEPARAPVEFAPDEPPPILDEPSHVSEEPVVVEELAEPGAEEGAGASIEIAEPWEGYDAMTAKEVITRLRSSGAAELAVVELYESAERRRETVLAAVEKELRAKNGDGRTSSRKE